MGNEKRERRALGAEQTIKLHQWVLGNSQLCSDWDNSVEDLADLAEKSLLFEVSRSSMSKMIELAGIKREKPKAEQTTTTIELQQMSRDIWSIATALSHVLAKLGVKAPALTDIIERTKP